MSGLILLTQSSVKQLFTRPAFTKGKAQLTALELEKRSMTFEACGTVIGIVRQNTQSYKAHFL